MEYKQGGWLPKQSVELHVRISPALANLLRESAKENNRSLNAEIIHRLSRQDYKLDRVRP